MKPASASPSGLVRTLSGPAFRRVTRSLMRGRTPVFMLHRVDDAAQNIHGHAIPFIRDCILALRASGAKIVPLSVVVAAWRERAPVDPAWTVFTLDDGFADQVRIVREVFAPLRCPATIFLITGQVDGQLWPWDDQVAYLIRGAAPAEFRVTLGDAPMSLDLRTPQGRGGAIGRVRDCLRAGSLDPYSQVAALADALGRTLPTRAPPEYAAMSWDDARALEDAGVEFGPHSVSHRTVSRLGDDDARAEVLGSWQRLKQELRRPVPIFAWPRGQQRDFGVRDIALARASGIEACVTTEPGHATCDPGDPDTNYRIRRFALPETLDKVLRYGSWLERARELLPF